MNILFDNINVMSNSGPNSFGKKLSMAISVLGHSISLAPAQGFMPDIQLSFIAASHKYAPIIQRLDGIYFNSAQDFNLLNKPIEATYKIADAVIFQSEFNRTLTQKFFGEHENAYVIHNGTDLNAIEKIQPIESPIIDQFEEVWSCASSWRPHKRLKDNVRYFLEHAPENACLIIAGENPDHRVADTRVFYAGQLEWSELISLYKRSSHFIHLAWLDHCPNVVVDARACGCHIVCSSSGGTSEIAGLNSTIIEEEEWNLSPIKLYSPPHMDFSKKLKNSIDKNIDISFVSKKYLEVFEKTMIQHG